MQAAQQWVVVAQFPDEASGQVTIGLLQTERVPVRLRRNSLMPGLDLQCDVEVPSEYGHRARWILQHCNFSDAELNFLATGEPLEDPE